MSGESGAEVTAQNGGFRGLYFRSISGSSPLGGFLRLLPLLLLDDIVVTTRNLSCGLKLPSPHSSVKERRVSADGSRA